MSKIEINTITVLSDCVEIEYATNKKTVSTKIYNIKNLSPNKIIEKGYAQIKPHINIKYDSDGMAYKLPELTDKQIEILTEAAIEEEIEIIEVPVEIIKKPDEVAKELTVEQRLLRIEKILGI